MTTEPSSTAASGARSDSRFVPAIALILTMAWGIGWIWVADSGAEQWYLWIGAPVIALMWVGIGWQSRRRPPA